MSEWQTDEDITAAKLNQKEVYIGSSAPSSPTEGQLWYDTVNKILKVYHTEDSSWKTVITNITQIAGRSHADLQNIGANDHHTAFTPAQHDNRDHSIVADSIALSELGSRKHSELTDIGENDHHSKIHGHSEHSFGEAEVVANKGEANGYAGLTSIKTLPIDYFEIEASDNAQHSNDTMRSTPNNSWTKVKEIKLLNALRGASLKIKFELLAQGSTTAHAKIYLNGSPMGQDHSTTNTTEWQVFEETFSNINLQPNDLLQIYAYSSAGSGTYAKVRNFRLCFDLKPHKFVNQDP